LKSVPPVRCVAPHESINVGKRWEDVDSPSTQESDVTDTVTDRNTNINFIMYCGLSSLLTLLTSMKEKYPQSDPCFIIMCSCRAVPAARCAYGLIDASHGSYYAWLLAPGSESQYTAISKRGRRTYCLNLVLTHPHARARLPRRSPSRPPQCLPRSSRMRLGRGMPLVLQRRPLARLRRRRSAATPPRISPSRHRR
jgi:hypothetical protein